MINGNHDLRVRYSDTDQMGYVYYGRYASYYEIARVELFRKLGFSYRKLEEKGIGMPVIEMNSKFLLPVKYDELISIQTVIKELPTLKICFYYEIFNSKNKLVNTGKTVLTFIDLKSKKPVRTPKTLLSLIKKKFNEK